MMTKRRFAFLLILAGLYLLFLLPGYVLPARGEPSANVAATTTATPVASEHPIMPPIPTGLEPPPTVYPPTPADQGEQLFYKICIACHGDHGQGLTKEFLELIGLPNSNCWKSGCHGSHRPENSFAIPTVVPAVIGNNALAAFPTALQLHDFIHKNMPYQAPGSLTDEQYWQLTAFLLRANGINPGTKLLDPESASQIYIGAQPPTPTPNIPFFQTQVAGGIPVIWILGGIGLLLLISIVIVIAFRLR